MRRILNAGLAAAILLGGSLALADEPTVSDPDNPVFKLDYSAEFAECEMFLPDSNDSIGAFSAKDLPARELTELEHAVFCKFVHDDGAIHGYGITVLAVCGFLNRNGRYPYDALELRSKKTRRELLTKAGLAEFQKLPKVEQMVTLGRALNPLTGKIYTSFEEREWTPFGILIEKATGDDATKMIPFIRQQEDGPALVEMQEHRTWRIIVYGEEPGSVLVDKYIYTLVDSGDEYIGEGY